MKKNIFNDYLSFIRSYEQKMKFQKLKNSSSNFNQLDPIRISHYKSDIVLSLLLQIEQKKEISFDCFAGLLDFRFIENTLLLFPSRFQLFEMFLKTYIQNLKSMDFQKFLLAFSMLDLANVLNQNDPEIDLKAKQDYEKRLQNLPVLEELFSKKPFSFREAKDALISLNLNEHFAHFFLIYLQEKYQKRKLIPENLVDYYFSKNILFIYFSDFDQVFASHFEKEYPSLKNVDTQNETMSKNFHFALFHLLEGNYGDYFIGLYDAIEQVMRFCENNDQEDIFLVTLKALLNDIIYTKKKNFFPQNFHSYQILEKTLKDNFSLTIFKQPNKEELKNVLNSFQIDPKFISIFVDELVLQYEKFMKKKEIPPVYKTKISTSEKEITPTIIDPFLKEDLKAKKRQDLLCSIFSQEEKESYFLALEYLTSSNSSIKGYCEDLAICIQDLEEIADGILNNSNDKELYMELLKETLDKINEICFQIKMVIPYQRNKRNF